MRAPRAAPLAPSLAPSLAALAALAACNASTIVVGELQEVTALKAIPNRKLDLLFVVDDSNGMLDLQLALGQSLPRMLDVLSRLDGGLPDLHVGVVSSDMGTLASGSPTPAPSIGVVGQGGCVGAGLDGALQARSAALQARYLSDVAAPDGARVRNYTGALPDVLAELVALGAGGCGFEQPLAATRRALANPLNAGFLREDANLAVVLVSDEDDCSARDPALFGPESPELGPLASFRCTRFGVVCDPDDLAPGPKTGCAPRASSLLVEDVQPFADALVAAKPDPRMVTAAAIVGDPEPFALELQAPPGGGTPQLSLAHSCQFQGASGGEVADPAVRLAAFVDAFPGSQLASICSADLGPAVTAASGALRKLLGEPCLDAPLADASPEPGLQPACEVVDVRDSAPGRARALPGCATGAADCFEIVSDEAACPSAPDHLRVRFRRATEVTDDTWSHVRCQLHR
jgi:hypothetical protein